MPNIARHQLSESEAEVCRLTGCDPSIFDAPKMVAMSALNADEQTICLALNVAEEAFLAARDGGGEAVSVPSGASAAVALSACAFALTRGNLQTIRIQLTPAGDFTPNDGRALPVRRWHIDRAIASAVIARFQDRKTALVVDYEHQTLHKEKNGKPAPAAAWFKALEWQDGVGLFGVVELTNRARQAINAGEYKYVSPVFAYDQATGNVLDIRMAAFTNTPAIDGMEPLEQQAAASSGAMM